MAKNSDLETRLCLVWETERPYMDELRKSSNFSLLGAEWNLQMKCRLYEQPRRNYYVYVLSLHRGTRTENLGDSSNFSVSAFIEDKGYELPILGRYKEIKSTNEILCEFSRDDLSDKLSNFSSYRELKIVCLFHGFPSTVLQAKNETVTLTTQGDKDSPLASDQDSKGPLKETFSAEKSVQACMGVPPDLESLSLDFCKLLEQNIFPDVKRKCGDRVTSVHRSVLAARSEVFSAMFRNKMVESETGVVDVTDLDSTVLDLLLKYVYSRKLQDLSEDTASILYAAGDKYAIHALKKACSDWMIRNLSEENCLVSLILSDVHSDESFKNDVINFMSQHLQVLRTPAWFKLCEEHPRLVNIVYQKCFALSFTA